MIKIIYCVALITMNAILCTWATMKGDTGYAVYTCITLCCGVGCLIYVLDKEHK